MSFLSTSNQEMEGCSESKEIAIDVPLLSNGLGVSCLACEAVKELLSAN